MSDDGTMHDAAFDLARRTAATAAPFADTLAEDCAAIAQALRAGDLDATFEAFETHADRLQRFLTFLVVASELLVDAAPTVGTMIADYNRRLLSVLDRIQGTLSAGDLVGLTLALEHGLSPALMDYQRYAADVRQALTPAMAA